MVLLIIAFTAFWVGSTLDLLSSQGKREGWPIYRNHAGYFNLNRYLLINAVAFTGMWVIALASDLKTAVCVIWIVLGAARAAVALLHNRKIKRAA
jgi:hypothetical protein